MNAINALPPFTLKKRAWAQYPVPIVNRAVPWGAQLVARRELAEGEVLFTFKPVSGSHLAPGEFVGAFSRTGEKAAFSICSPEYMTDADGNPIFQVAIRKILQDGFDPNDYTHLFMNVSKSIHSYEIGEIVYFTGPHGHELSLVEHYGRDVIFLCAGTSFYPIRKIALMLEQVRDKFGTVKFLFGSRSPDLQYFPELLGRWRDSGLFEVLRTVDPARIPEDAEKLQGWREHVGFLHTLIALLEPFEQGREPLIIMSGPQAVFGHLINALEPLGMDPERTFLILEGKMNCTDELVCGPCIRGWNNTLLCRTVVPSLAFVRANMPEVIA